jgi:hypothetical protein
MKGQDKLDIPFVRVSPAQIVRALDTLTYPASMEDMAECFENGVQLCDVHESIDILDEEARKEILQKLEEKIPGSYTTLGAYRRFRTKLSQLNLGNDGMEIERSQLSKVLGVSRGAASFYARRSPYKELLTRKKIVVKDTSVQKNGGPTDAHDDIDTKIVWPHTDETARQALIARINQVEHEVERHLGAQVTYSAIARGFLVEEDGKKSVVTEEFIKAQLTRLAHAYPDLWSFAKKISR